MNWWVLTYLDIYRPPHSLSILAETNNRDHMFMAWSTIKPARQRVHKTVRGLHVFCGYRWIWDTPNIVEQSQPGGTYEHLFGPIPLQPTDPVWFYLFALPELAVRFRQTALFHVPPPELPMPSARIFHSLPQPCNSGVMTILTFDSVIWDDNHFYDPADPTRLNIALGALYSFGASARLVTAAPCDVSLQIRVNAGPANVYHSHVTGPTGWGGAGLSLHGIMRFQPGDSIQCRIWHNAGAARMIAAAPDYTPHFWIALIGAYPISPP